MLQIIRERFTGPIAFAVIAAIGITLVISFGNMDTGGGRGNFAAEVNGEEIPILNYQRVVQNELVRQQEAFQGEFPESLQEQLQRNVLENMIRNKVLTQHVRDSGYRVDAERVKNFIRSQPVFQVGGEYSYESYIAVLSSQGLSPERYELDQQAALEVGQLDKGIVLSSFFTPTEYRQYISLLNEQRDAQYASFDPAALKEDIEVSEESLRSYYDNNPDEFKTEESVSLEYVEIRLDDISKKVVIDEPAIQEFYEANADRYRSQEQRLARHILITTDADTDEAAAEQTISELSERLVAGEAFEQLAREFSDDPVSAEQGGALEWSGRGDFVSAFEEALFSLNEGETSDPVRTEFGYHLIRLDEVKAATQRSYEEVHDELLAELQLQEAADQFYALAEQVDDVALENPDSLVEVAAASGLDLQRIDNFTRAGGAPFGYNQLLVDTVFGIEVLEDRENSALLEIDDDRAVVVRVAEYRPSRLMEFDEVKAAVIDIVKLEQAALDARTRGEALLERLQSGEAFDALAAEFGLELIPAEQLSRSTADVDAELLAAIFRTPKPVAGRPIYRGLGLGNGAYAVFRLDAVREGRPDEIPQQERDQRKQMLAQQLGSVATEALVTDLRADAKVFVAPDLFDQNDNL
jgi:peptidyl-prolyl cis-trans isomerase D